MPRLSVSVAAKGAGMGQAFLVLYHVQLAIILIVASVFAIPVALVVQTAVLAMAGETSFVLRLVFIAYPLGAVAGMAIWLAAFALSAPLGLPRRVVGFIAGPPAIWAAFTVLIIVTMLPYGWEDNPGVFLDMPGFMGLTGLTAAVGGGIVAGEAP